MLYGRFGRGERRLGRRGPAMKDSRREHQSIPPTQVMGLAPYGEPDFKPFAATVRFPRPAKEFYPFLPIGVICRRKDLFWATGQQHSFQLQCRFILSHKLLSEIRGKEDHGVNAAPSVGGDDSRSRNERSLRLRNTPTGLLADSRPGAKVGWEKRRSKAATGQSGLIDTQACSAWLEVVFWACAKISSRCIAPKCC